MNGAVVLTTTTLHHCFKHLEFISENETSMYQNSESKVFKNVKFVSEISNNWPSNLL